MDKKHQTPETLYGRKGEMKLIRKDQVVPQNAIRMTNHDVQSLQNAKINKWKPASDVWPLVYGGSLLGTSTVVSSIAILSYFRTRFRLGKKALLSSYLLSTIWPTVTAAFAHESLVKPEILSISHCPTCIEVRSGVIQTMCSTLYPVIPSVLLSIFFSKRYGTHLGRDEFHPGLRHAVKSTIKSRNIFTAIAFANFGLAYWVAYQQGRSLEYVMNKEAERYAKREILKDEL